METDKIQHVVAGLIIGAIGTIFWSPILGFILATIAGALKEIIWDWLLKKGDPSFFDAMSTSGGGLIVSFLIGISGCSYDKLTMASCNPENPYVSHVLTEVNGELRQSNIVFDVPPNGKFTRECIQKGIDNGIPINPNAKPHEYRKQGKVKW